MKNATYIGILTLALGVLLYTASDRLPSTAIAAGDGAHAGHNHGKDDQGKSAPDLDWLFDDGEEDDASDDVRHTGHADDRHSDHDDHADHDAHAGHDDHSDHDAPKSGTVDGHAGHDDHDDHGHGHAHGSGDEICPEHRVPEAIDALCQAGHIGELRPGQGMQVRLAATDVAGKAGIRTTTPQEMVLTDGTHFPGRTVFNREKRVDLTPLADGVVRRLHVQAGAAVQAGEILVELAMPELATLQAAYLGARARLEQFEAAYRREQDLLERGISSRQEFQQAQAELHTARSQAEQFRQQLLNHGLREADLDRLATGRLNDSRVALRAPFAGIITEVQTAVGEAGAPGRTLLTLVDPDPLWIELSIPESRLELVEAGTAIQARFTGLPGRVFSGELFQVGAAIDERSRTIKALARVANPGHRLKAGMFGSVQIVTAHAAPRLMVPAEAVQSIDGLPYLFVQSEPDLFELRRVTTGPRQDSLLAILAGVVAGDRVVSSQGFALKSEVLKARLGATCADH
ncbi:MAG: efflux RND transporter periplasmic adaptor subunit [Desulfuromonadales bacterium]|nr:efflux RND transporter periplasmic adaptor subunit [Desulfuromonadales bacterium]